MKTKVTIYLTDANVANLDHAARLPGTTKSAVVDDALRAFFNPDRNDGIDNAIARRLSRLQLAIGRIERDVAISTEVTALFVRYFLTITPPLPKPEQDAARTLGRERFDVFVAQVGRRLAGDHRLVSEVLENIADTNPDLFATASDDVPLTTQTTHNPTMEADND